MKKIKLCIHEPTINKVIEREQNLVLDEEASLVDSIKEVDKILIGKGGFPVKDYRSLLHMVYNPVENRFYKQVAVTAYDKSGQTINVRENPREVLPQNITITLIPAGGCISEWEEVVDYAVFAEN